MRPGAKALCPPVPGDFTAGHGVGDKVSVVGTRTAVYGGGCRTVDWLLAGDLSDRRRSITVSLWDISLVSLPVDAEGEYEAMSLDGRNEGEGCCEERQE